MDALKYASLEGKINDAARRDGFVSGLFDLHQALGVKEVVQKLWIFENAFVVGAFSYFGVDLALPALITGFSSAGINVVGVAINL